jgi:hypothetical protein
MIKSICGINPMIMEHGRKCRDLPPMLIEQGDVRGLRSSA